MSAVMRRSMVQLTWAKSELMLLSGHQGGMLTKTGGKLSKCQDRMSNDVERIERRSVKISDGTFC